MSTRTQTGLPLGAGGVVAPSRAWQRAGLLAALAVVAVVPALPFVNSYLLAVMVRALIFISLGQAWNIIAGIGGQLSLGNGVFLGLGAYAAGWLFNQYGIPPWFGIWPGVALSLAAAFPMGAMTLRIRGIFFALATVAVGGAAA